MIVGRLREFEVSKGFGGLKIEVFEALVGRCGE